MNMLKTGNDFTGGCEFCNHSKIEIRIEIRHDDRSGKYTETCGNPRSKYFGREIHDDIYALTNSCELWERIPDFPRDKGGN